MKLTGMSLSDILFLYRARLRARAVLVQEGFAILGIAVGVALLFASQVASTSLTQSVAQLTSEIVGQHDRFQLQSRGDNGFDERLLDQVRQLPGVRSAQPVLEQQATVIGSSGRTASVDLIGIDPHFARSSGPLLRRFSARQLAAQRVIALPAPLASSIGAGALQTIKLQVGANVRQTLLGTTLGQADIGNLIHNPVALAPIAYAQSLGSLQGRLTRVLVEPEPGREAQVRAALTRLAATAGVNLGPADFTSKLFAVAAAPENQGETLFSAISALVGFMFALNAMLITVPSRRRLIEDIRPQGASRAMTIQILLFDALILGVLACIVGLTLGELLSVAAFHSTPGYLSFAFPVGNARIVNWQTVALAVGAGFAAAVLGVLWPLRDTLARPLRQEALARAPRGGRGTLRLLIGVASLAITTIILILHPQSAVLGNFTLIAALVCLLPFLFEGVVIVFDRAQRLFNGASTVLAITELRSPPSRVRSLAIAATGAIAVFGMVAVQGAQDNLQHGLNSAAHGIDSKADVWVTLKGESNAFATDAFTDASSRALAALPGVASLGLYRGSFLDWGDRRLWVLAPSGSITAPIPSGQLVEGSLGLASARVHQGGWAVLSQALATEHHLHIGQLFTLPAPRLIRLRVAALSTNLGWPPGALIMSSEDYARAWADQDPSAYELHLKPGVSPAAVRRQVQGLLSVQSGLMVETAGEREQRHYALAQQGLSRLTQIRLLVLVAAVLAVAGALGSMIWQRRDLVAFIKCQGYSRGVLWRWLLCESALLLGAGCSIGAVFGIYGQLLISHALASVTGFPIFFNVEVLVALMSFVLVTVVAVAIVGLGGLLVVRVPPRTANPV